MSESTRTPQSPAEPNHQGGRRLVILGISAISIAFIASSISLFIYTSSGDIYLDRSRPGFIFEDELEPKNGQAESTAAFAPDGTVTNSTLDEYLDKLDALIKDVSAESDAFSDAALSDEALNITIPVDY